ncbi:membrane protein insertion efficiency factor YidD [Kitasatospora sp. KL5]|uniref:membrane protein insertion efficiency factor YidD n=1 Tax=Kitasatospora sp. KL5 TaxID=3425125 RepID=UPI003D6DC0FF
MSQHHPHHVQQHSGPPPRPGRAWWWLPEHERRRRREQKRIREEWKRRNKRKDDNDCCDACDCFSGFDPCMIALIPVMLASVLKAFTTRGRAGADTDPAAPVPTGPLAAGLYGAVRHYRTRISPGRPACCPYTPSCSTYAVQALHRHGALRGSRLTLGRLLRCRPGTSGGNDPVPGR